MPDVDAQRSGPLADVRVLDLSRLVAGNMLTAQLADFGADVIKLEPPEGDPLRAWRNGGKALWWKVYARNKRSIRLTLKSEPDKALFRSLLATAAVLVESFRPGILEAAGFSPAELHKLNPKLVIVRISGFGQTGPYSGRPGFGSLIEGMSGFAAKNGFPDQPPVLPNMPLADMTAGISAAFATMIALRVAERTGAGQVIDVSLLEPLHSMLGPDAAIYQFTGQTVARTGNRASVNAPRNVYRTSDDQYVVLSAATQAMTIRLFHAIGRGDMAEDPRFATNTKRLENVDALDEPIAAFIGARTLAENLAHFEAAEVTVGPILDAAGFAQNEHVRERGVLIQWDDEDCGAVAMHAPVPRLSATPGRVWRGAPGLGQDEDALAAEFSRRTD